MPSARAVARVVGVAFLGAAFFGNVRPLSTPASDPTATQRAAVAVAHAFATLADAAIADVAADPAPAPIGPIPLNVPSASPSPYPQPTRGAGYDPAKNVVPPARGGPVTVAVNGNLLATRHVQFFGGGDSAGSGATGTESFGATVEIARRTAQTATRFTFPTNLSGQSQAELGAITGEYDTTTLSYLFGPQQISGLNLVALGSTLRGIAITAPLRHGGDLTIFDGPGQSGVPTYAIRGARLRVPVKDGFAGFSVFDAKVENDVGRTDGFAAGLATRLGKLQTQTEAVVERNNGLALTPNGTSFSAQSRFDLVAGLNAATITLRDASSNFVNVASANGSTPQDAFVGLGFRRASPHGQTALLNLSEERTSQFSQVQESLVYQGRVGAAGSASIGLTNAAGTNGGIAQWSGSTQLSYSGSFRGNIAAQANVALSRGTSAGADPQGGYSFGLGFSRFFGADTAANAFYTYQQQSSSTTGNAESANLTIGLTRQFKKTSVLVGLGLLRNAQAGSDQRGIAPTVTIARRISPALTFDVTAVGDFHSDHLDPTAKAHTVGVNVSIGAPLAFGNGVVNGRVNPRLPATIDGYVAQDGVTQSSSFGLNVTAGVGNLLVVLDGTRSVRTDSRGQFSFSFVPPGRHDVVIDPTSLPLGLTADQPSTTVVLQGGQIAHLALGVGTFGVIEGHLYGRDGSGGLVPIPEAIMLLDDKARALTNAQGYYGFGRLSPGKYTVHVDLSSVPATIALPTENGKPASVIPGQRVTVDFVGAPLGSISGSLVYDGSFDANEAGKPVLNAYVVANPGDHAAIVDDLGHFTIDNLAAGTYEVSVDEDTLADDHGVVSQYPLEAVLAPGGSIDKLAFTIGNKPRSVVFSFKQGDVNALEVRLPLNGQPPGVGVPITVTATEEASGMTVTGLGGKPVELVPSADKKVWRGTLHVPASAASGDIALSVKALGKHPGEASAKIRVDQNVPIAFFILRPSRPVPNQYVHVRARFFTDIKAGDTIAWPDGQVTVLRAPQNKIVEFDVKMASVPFTGTLSSGGERYRVTLQAK